MDLAPKQPCDRSTSSASNGSATSDDDADDQSIREAMALIDRGLGDISGLTIVSTSEMADLLLDVRGLLSRLDTHVSTN